MKITLGDLRSNHYKCPYCSDITNVHYKALPPKNGQRILAFDQATKVTAYSIYDNGKLVSYGQKSFIGSDIDKRLEQAFLFFREVMIATSPDMVYFEDIQLQGNKYTAFKSLAKLQGVAITAAQSRGIPYHFVFNKVWQKSFAITGRDRKTQKENCMKKVKQLFNITVNDDIADAILIGKHAVYQNQQSDF